MLRTLGGFVKDCSEAQEKYKNVDKQSCIKKEEIEIKVENGRDVQEASENIDYIKSEEIEIKSEDGDQDK